jgi:hypothetical protein
MSVTADSRAVVERYLEAAASGDRAVLEDVFAPDASWTLAAGSLPVSGTWTGREQILDGFLAQALSHYAPGSIDIHVDDWVAEDDRVVLQWTSRARTTDGRPYENGCIGVFTVRDGRIQSVREYMDTLYAGETLFASSATSTTRSGSRLRS